MRNHKHHLDTLIPAEILYQQVNTIAREYALGVTRVLKYKANLKARGLDKPKPQTLCTMEPGWDVVQ